MESQQAPRRVRLAEAERKRKEAEKLAALGGAGVFASRKVGGQSIRSISPSVSAAKIHRLSVSEPTCLRPISPSIAPPLAAYSLKTPTASTSTSVPSTSSAPPPALEVKCHVRTRIPTPHGHVFLYLYKNNHDDKEHLAFVADQAQMDARPGEAGPSHLPFLRSETLDSKWREGETEMERIVRGAYVGRLSAESITPSVPGVPSLVPRRNSNERRTELIRRASLAEAIPDGESPQLPVEEEREPPLVRIHSECFTGETIGSQRCDCGEQLDEAFRLITLMGRGIVVYLRQEGRGIGLLEKMRAYNLQDLGHDTVTANLLLGHGADLRTYDVAGAILRDLDVGEVRLLTNNPDKIEQIEKEGIAVVERVAMVPRSWMPKVRKPSHGRRRKHVLSGATLLALASESIAMHGREPEAEEEGNDSDSSSSSSSSTEDSDASHNLRRAGVGMIGASTTHSKELEKYLRTKVERMGHLLDLPTTPPSSRSDSPGNHSYPHHHHNHHEHGRRGAVKKELEREKEEESLVSSVASLKSQASDGSGVDCGTGCKDCA